jgi:hypothetical protein
MIPLLSGFVWVAAGVQIATGQLPFDKMTVKPVESHHFVNEQPDHKDGPQISILAGDPEKGPTTAIIRFKGALPMHWHSSPYEALVMEGIVKHYARQDNPEAAPTLRPGSYWFQTARDVHTDVCVSASGDCMVYVRTFGKLDMTVEASASASAAASTSAAAPAQARTQSQAQESLANRYITADRTPWYVEAPGVPVKLAKLWGDRTAGEAGTLLTAPAGFHAGLHSHTADYWAVVVQGTWQHLVPSTGEGKGLRLEPGAFWTQKHTELHDDWCISKTPCVIFLFNKDPYVTEFPKSK